MPKERSVLLGAAGRAGDPARRWAARRRIRETLALRRADAAAGLRAGCVLPQDPRPGTPERSP